jgi:hypothetical protein
VFVKLVKYFLLFKFVSICFSFVKKRTKSFTNLKKAQYVLDDTSTHTVARKKEFSAWLAREAARVMREAGTSGVAGATWRGSGAPLPATISQVYILAKLHSYL